MTKNAAWQKLEVLKANRNKRHRYGEFLVEGVRNINEAVAKGWTIAAWIYAQGRPLSDWAKDLLSLFALWCILVEKMAILTA